VIGYQWEGRGLQVIFHQSNLLPRVDRGYFKFMLLHLLFTCDLV